MSSEKRDSNPIFMLGLLAVIFITFFGTYSQIRNNLELGVTVKKKEIFRKSITGLKKKCFDKSLPALIRFEMLKNNERDYLKFLKHIEPKEDPQLKNDLIDIRAGLVAVCLELGKIKEAENYLASKEFAVISEQERKYFENKLQFLKENPTEAMEREELFNQLVEERNQRIDADFKESSKKAKKGEKDEND